MTSLIDSFCIGRTTLIKSNLSCEEKTGDVIPSPSKYLHGANNVFLSTEAVTNEVFDTARGGFPPHNTEEFLIPFYGWVTHVFCKDSRFHLLEFCISDYCFKYPNLCGHSYLHFGLSQCQEYFNHKKFCFNQCCRMDPYDFLD